MGGGDWLGKNAASDVVNADLLAAMAEDRMADAVRITVSDVIRLNDDEQACP
jgi:hypothetical protein